MLLAAQINERDRFQDFRDPGHGEDQETRRISSAWRYPVTCSNSCWTLALEAAEDVVACDHQAQFTTDG
jgi:hypothetical protein